MELQSWCRSGNRLPKRSAKSPHEGGSTNHGVQCGYHSLGRKKTPERTCIVQGWGPVFTAMQDRHVPGKRVLWERAEELVRKTSAHSPPGVPGLVNAASPSTLLTGALSAQHSEETDNNTYVVCMQLTQCLHSSPQITDQCSLPSLTT